MKAWYIEENIDKIKKILPVFLENAYITRIEYIPNKGEMRRVLCKTLGLNQVTHKIMKANPILKAIDRTKSGHMSNDYEVVLYNNTSVEERTLFIWLNLPKDNFYKVLKELNIKLT